MLFYQTSQRQEHLLGMLGLQVLEAEAFVGLRALQILNSENDNERQESLRLYHQAARKLSELKNN